MALLPYLGLLLLFLLLAFAGAQAQEMSSFPGNGTGPCLPMETSCVLVSPNCGMVAGFLPVRGREAVEAGVGEGGRSGPRRGGGRTGGLREEKAGRAPARVREVGRPTVRGRETVEASAGREAVAAAGGGGKTDGDAGEEAGRAARLGRKPWDDGAGEGAVAPVTGKKQ